MCAYRKVNRCSQWLACHSRHGMRSQWHLIVRINSLHWTTAQNRPHHIEGGHIELTPFILSKFARHSWHCGIYGISIVAMVKYQIVWRRSVTGWLSECVPVASKQNITRIDRKKSNCACSSSTQFQKSHFGIIAPKMKKRKRNIHLNADNQNIYKLFLFSANLIHRHSTAEKFEITFRKTTVAQIIINKMLRKMKLLIA